MNTEPEVLHFPNPTKEPELTIELTAAELSALELQRLKDELSAMKKDRAASERVEVCPHLKRDCEANENIDMQRADAAEKERDALQAKLAAVRSDRDEAIKERDRAEILKYPVENNKICELESDLKESNAKLAAANAECDRLKNEIRTKLYDDGGPLGLSAIANQRDAALARAAEDIHTIADALNAPTEVQDRESLVAWIKTRVVP